MDKKEEKEENEYQRMTETPIPKLVSGLAVPTIISMLVTSVYNVADTFFVSRLGTSASGATGIVFSLMAVIQAAGFTVGMGAGSTISRLLGKKKEKEAEEIAASAFLAAAVSGLALSVLGLCFLDRLIRLLGATETILPYAKDYAFYILMAAPVMTLSFVLNNLLRAEGKAKFSMVGIGIGGILNIALDPLLIFVFGLGIRGAAIATAVSQCTGFFILFSMFLLKKTTVALRFKNVAKKFKAYGTILKNGMPSLGRQGLASIASVALNISAAAHGDAAVAAMSIVGKVFMIVFSVLIGFGQGYQPVAGFNYGARRFDRVKKAFKFMVIAGTIMMSAIGAAGILAAPFLIRLFIQNDREVVQIGTMALRLQCCALPFMPLGIACNMTFQAVGKPIAATFLASCRQGVFFLPLIMILPRMFGVLGIEATQPLADAGTFFICIPFIIHFMKHMQDGKGKAESK